MKTEIMNNLTRSMYRTAFKIKKYSPEILAVTGVTGIIVSGVMACRATTKLNPILEEKRKNIDLVLEAVEDGIVMTEDPVTKELVPIDYTPEDGKKDITIHTAKTGLKLIKLYAPSVVLGVFSIGCMLQSNNIMRQRNIALAAAYTAVDQGFKDYRGRVIERFGEALDRELKYGIKTQKVTETVTDEETGKTKKVTKTINVVDPDTSHSQYTFVFDETCAGWQRDAELNKFFLVQQERYLTERLEKKGHLFLNEALDALGIKRCRMGNIVGWIFDEKHPIGDNRVDFGLFNNIHDEQKRLFVNGHEYSVWLDFNCDGDILRLMS